MSKDCEKNRKHTLLECDKINIRRKCLARSQEGKIVREVPFLYTGVFHLDVPSIYLLHWQHIIRT